MDKIKEIEQFYYDNGIHSLNFTCQFKDDCGSGSNKFSGPKSAFIPDGYWNANPRIAFLSLDSGDGYSDPTKRTPLAVRQQEQFECRVDQLPKGRHWYETHFWTKEIYNAISHEEITIQDTCNIFCHLNSAKCCQNKKGSREADIKLFRNCRAYLKGELEILRPHILITQGNNAKDSIENLAVDRKKLGDYVEKIDIGFTLLWVRTYHPSSYGFYYKQKRQLGNIIQLLSKNYP